MWRLWIFLGSFALQLLLGYAVPVILALGFFVDTVEWYEPFSNCLNWLGIIAYSHGVRAHLILISSVGYCISSIVLISAASLVKDRFFNKKKFSGRIDS